VFNALRGSTGENILLLRIQSVKAETGERSNATIYANIREGLFPSPVLIGKRSVGWPDFEVQAICAARISGKSQAEIKELVKYLHSRRSTLLDDLLSAASAFPTKTELPITARKIPRLDDYPPNRSRIEKTGGSV
jgi:prophage regulatory protein